MYLKRLEIHGFKSFAARTVFEFGPGITAVIGPNGSGKSNVADALRWVLGEQSARAMRLRRLDDALFAGGERRAPAGFAEVSIWLDNAEGWLPLEVGEVVITRRLHRSGETDYLLNRRRVRLRDINDIFLQARLGQNSYAIMGQGLVDHVLSLRPDERRALIEEAAEIRRYRARIDEARQRLGATRENVAKARLLLDEIAPRLTQLERQAKRAREHEALARELAACVRAWYRHEWRARSEALAAARARYDERMSAFTAAQSALDHLTGRLDDVRLRLAERGRERRAADEEVRRLGEEERATAQRLRLEEERLVFVRRRLDELEAELAALDSERGELRRTVEDGGGLAGDLDGARAAATERQRALAAFDAAEAAAGRMRNEAENALRRRRGEVRDVEERLARLVRELAAAGREVESGDARRRSFLARLAEYGRRFRDRRRELGDAEAGQRDADERRDLSARALEAAKDEVDVRERGAAECRTVVAELERRREMLVRLRDQQRGANAAARLLLEASARGEAPRVLSLLGGVLRVPASVEVAVEAVLSANASAAIVQEQAGADAAVRLLCERREGRTSLIPLDALRRTEPPPIPEMDGVAGIAASFVMCEPRYRPVAEALLGRILIVEDMETARRVRGDGFEAVVTLDGTVLHANGVITAGRGAAEGGVLALERELVELPERIESARAELSSCDAALAAARAGVEPRRTATRRWTDESERLGRLATKARHALAGERASLAPLRGDLRYLRRLLETTAERAADLAAERDRLANRRAELGDGLDEIEAAARNARRASEQAAVRREALARDLAEARGALAALEREHQALETMRATRRAALTRLDERLAARSREAAGRRDEIAGVERDCASMRAVAADLNVRRLRAEEMAAPLRDAVRGLTREVQELEPLHSARQRSLATLERECLTAETELQRRAEELDRLRREMEEEGLDPALKLEVCEVPPRDPAEGQPLDPGRLHERIRVLRGRIRALGAVNPEAEAEYRETRERHDVLAAQLADLAEAETALLRAIDQLEALIRERFGEAFGRIGADFERYFTTFFGGGTARLALTGGEDGREAGVDIIARPPGKRQQSLSLLSGGERSMTAVALLFALLESNPAPFSVLDEVDAALDESNVGRFGRALSDLAGRTQFIVITHNRLTIEAASAIYGVSMGRDSASSVLSLRLEDVPNDEP